MAYTKLLTQPRQIVELEITDERTPDCKKVIELVEGVKG